MNKFAKVLGVLRVMAPIIAWMAFVVFTLLAMSSSALVWQVTLGLSAGLSLVAMFQTGMDPLG